MNAQPHESSQPQPFAYRGAFLEQFPRLRRSLVTNQFCFAVRSGAATVEDVLTWVAQDARRRVGDHFADEEARGLQRYLLSTLEYSEATQFAEFILERERLSSHEKKQRRAVAGRAYAERYMAEMGPTEKQSRLLRKLGVDVTPANRLEASNAIDRLLQRGEGR